jgi:hypothetical protein
LLRQKSIDHEVVIDSSGFHARLGNRDRDVGIGTLITLIGPTDIRCIDSEKNSRPKGLQEFGERSALPCFRPDSPEDSLFLPRCGHAVSSHSVFGGWQKWGDCQMTIKANGRSALILATGLFVCLAGPSQAAPASADNAAASSRSDNAAGAPIALNKYAKHGSRHYAHRKSSKLALKSADSKKAAATDIADNDADSPTAIPPSVANANALASADTSTGNAARAMSARANDILQSAPDNPADARPAAEMQVVSADQLNDVDRALQESRPPALALASADAPVAPVMASSSGESSTWDQTSLIGKIFIGFGALLTMASAARMFMA